MRVSNSKINTFRRCEKRYEFKYIEKLKPRAKSIQLERGTWVHSLLEAHYKGENWKKVHKAATKEFYNLFEETREELGDLPAECKRIMESYLRYWTEVDQHYVCVDTEINEVVTLPNGHELVIIIDAVMEDKRTGLLWPWDHKTRKTFENTENMMMDPQLTLYFKGLELLGYHPLGGVTYNEIRTKPPTIPQPLKAGGLSKAKAIDTDVYTYMKAIKDNDLDPNDYADILRLIAVRQKDSFFRRINLPKDPPLVKTMWKDLASSIEEIEAAEERGHFPRTFDKSCRYMCDYQSLCLAQLHGADIEPLIKLNYRRRGQD